MKTGKDNPKNWTPPDDAVEVMEKPSWTPPEDAIPVKKKDHTVSETASPSTSAQPGSGESSVAFEQPKKPSGKATEPNILNAPSVKAMQEVDLSKPEEETNIWKELGKFLIGDTQNKLFQQKQTKEQKVKSEFFKEAGEEEDKSLSHQIAQGLKQVGPSLDKAAVENISMLPKALAMAQHGVELGIEKITGAKAQPIENLLPMQAGKWIDDKARELGIGVIDPRHAGFLNSEIPHMFGNMLLLYMTGGASAAGKAGQLAEGLANEGLKGMTKEAIKHVGPTAAVAGAQMGVAEFEKAKEMGASDDAAFRTFLGTLPASGFYAVPLARQIERINNLTGGGIVNALKTKGINSIEMATQSAVYNTMSNAIAKNQYDPNRGYLEGLKESVGTGAFVGLIMPGVVKVAKENPKYRDEILKEARTVLEKPDVVKSPEQTISDAQDEIKSSGDLGNINQKAEEIVDNLKQQSNAVQEPKAGEVLQREQEQVGGTGSERGRVEQSVQGKETSGESNVQEPRTEETGNGGVGKQEETLNQQQNENETGNGETLQSRREQNREEGGTEQGVSLSDNGQRREEEVRGEENGGLGAQKVNESTIGFAPYRSKNVKTIKEDSEIRQSEDYKAHQENVQKIADGLGIKIVDKADTWGGYVDSETGVPVQEVSNMIHVEGPPEKIKLMAALLGKTSPEMQDSVLIGGYKNEGNGVEYRFNLGDFKQGEKAVKLLKENGLEYFTLDTKTGQLTILDPENTNTKNIVTFTESLKKNGIAHELRASKIEAEFIGSQDYDRIIGEGARTQVGAENGFDINAHIKGAEGKYEGIKNSKALEKFGVQPKDIPATSSLLTRLFEGLKQSGITTAKNVSDWVSIGKAAKQRVSALFQPTIYGLSKITKEPAFDKSNFEKDIASGRVSFKEPSESLEDKYFAITHPDDFYTGSTKIGNKKISEGGGGVFFTLARGGKGDVWASVSENGAKNFAKQLNESLEKNNGEGIVILSKRDDTKHSTSLQAKVGFVKMLLHYGKDKNGYDGLIKAIKDIYSIGNTKDAQKVIDLFDNYLHGGRMADGQTMNEAKTSYQNFRASLIKNANPLITQMMRDMGYEGPEFFDATQLKKGIYKATGKGIDTMFTDIGQEDFLKGVAPGSAYAAIKVNSKVIVEPNKGHPSYPFLIKTADGSPVKLDVFKRTFMTHGKNQAINGRSSEKGSFGVVTTTKPDYTFNKNADLNNPSSKSLIDPLSKYGAIDRTNALKQNANAQFRVKNGQKIIESLKDFSRVKNKAKAVVAFTHEVMHGTVTSILDAASEGNEVGLKHANTIVEEFNKATGKNITRDQLLQGNEQFKQGKTTDSYRAVQEFIARSWELYNRKGPKGFSESFQKVLDAISTSFRQVYKAWKGSEIDVPLSKELEGMFNELLGKENEKTETQRTGETTGGEPVSETATQEALPPQENKEVQGTEGLKQEAPEQGQKSLLNRAYFGATEETIKSEIEKQGLQYPIESHEEARRKADEFINSVGIDNALNAVRNNEVEDGAAAYIWAKAIDSMDNNPVEQAKLLGEFDTKMRSSGRLISALGDVYKSSDFNYNVERQISQFKTLNNGQIPIEVERKFRELDQKLKEANDKIKQLEANQNSFKRIAEHEKEERKKLITEKKKKEIVNFFDALKIDTKNNIATASILPIGVLPHVWNATVDVIKQAVLTGADVANAIQAGIDYIKANQKEPFDEKKFREEFTPEIQKIIPRKEPVKMPSVEQGKIKIPDSLIKELVANGASTIEELTDQVHSLIKETNPEITIREVRDAITKYGRTASMSQEAIDVEIRKMKRIGRQLSILEDIQKKQRPLRSGLQRDKLSDHERRLRKEINEGLKELPLDKEEEDRQWRTALDAVKSRLQNQISDLEHQIETGKKTPKKKGIEYDAEAIALHKRRDELKSIIEEIEGKQGVPDETRLKNAIKAAENSHYEYERRIREKDFYKREGKPLPESEELKIVKEQRDQAKKIYNELKESEGVAEAQRRESRKKAIRKSISEYERRIKEKDFVKKEPKKTSVDEELKRLKIQKNQIKEQFDIEQEKNRLANRTKSEKAWDATLDISNLPKSLLASIDMSAPLRQGIILSAGNPVIGGKSFVEMVRQAFSKERASQWLHELRMTDEYQLMKESKLFLSEPSVSLSAREEFFMSNLAEKIPVLGKLVAGSNRAYTGFLNKLRADVFNYGVNNLKDQGITIENNPEVYKAWASFINNASGRGELGALENSATVLNTVFFAPRYVASRINLLNPVTYAKMPQPVRIMAMKNMLSFLGFYAITAMMMSAAGAEEEKDPRSTDFGKFKFGDTRYDILAGFQPIIRLIGQLATGEVKRKGKIQSLTSHEKNGKIVQPQETRADILLRFGRSKLSPALGAAADLLTGKDMVGQPVTWDSELLKTVTPLYIQDIHSIYKSEGATGVLTSAIPAFFGVGVQNYPEKPEKQKKSLSLRQQIMKPFKEAMHPMDSTFNKLKKDLRK